MNEAFLDRAVTAYHDAGASVACNLVGMPINFAAAYSDYHVSGLNPAGNACLTDLAFVASRIFSAGYTTAEAIYEAKIAGIHAEYAEKATDVTHTEGMKKVA